MSAVNKEEDERCLFWSEYQSNESVNYEYAGEECLERKKIWNWNTNLEWRSKKKDKEEENKKTKR